jgi:predicted acylesterase/phospholipase RssA
VTPTQPFDAVVFAGGGNRCFWQVGFWEVLAPTLPRPPAVATGVSAGAAMATLIFSGRAERSLAQFKARTGANPRNFYPRNIPKRQPPFPHLGMYRGTLLDALDADALATLRNPNAPDVRVLLARYPTWLERRPWLGAIVAWAAYQAERSTVAPVHARVGRRVGFRPEVVSLRALPSAEDMADAILHSSCTPPVTPLFFRDQRPVIDGSVVDATSLPALQGAEADVTSTLVLLTRPVKRLPDAPPGRVYVHPSEPIRIGKFDYTDPAGIQATYDLGRRDAERTLRAGTLHLR